MGNVSNQTPPHFKGNHKYEIISQSVYNITMIIVQKLGQKNPKHYTGMPNNYTVV